MGFFPFGTDLGFRGWYIYGGDSFFSWRGRIGWLGEILRIFGSEEQRKRKKSNCNQGYPGMLFVTLGIFTHVRFFNVFVFEYLLYCWFCVDGKGHKLFWLILVAYLFASNLLWSFPLAWAHLKMWLYRLPSIFIIMPIGSLLVFSVLDHSSKFPGDCLLSIPYKPILLGR